MINQKWVFFLLSLVICIHAQAADKYASPIEKYPEVVAYLNAAKPDAKAIDYKKDKGEVWIVEPRLKAPDNKLIYFTYGWVQEYYRNYKDPVPQNLADAVCASFHLGKSLPGSEKTWDFSPEEPQIFIDDSGRKSAYFEGAKNIDSGWFKLIKVVCQPNSERGI